MAIRFSLSTIVGLIVTLALFYLMQALIAGGKSAMTKNTGGRLVDFVRVKQNMEVETKEHKAKKPPPPAQPPPEVKPQFSPSNVKTSGYSLTNPDIKIQSNIGGGGFGISDGEYLPIVKVQPVYPRRALSRGLTGWVVVEFTVTSQGTVKDAHVVSNCAWIKGPRTKGDCEDNPNSIFDSAAIRAAEKFKYKPKVIDGQPVDTAGVQNRLIFELTDEN